MTGLNRTMHIHIINNNNTICKAPQHPKIQRCCH